MGLFDKVKKAREESLQDSGSGGKSKKRAERAPKQKKKKGFLEQVGLKKENTKTKEELTREHRHGIIKQVFEYVRKEVDLGVREYYTTGNTDKLQELLAGDVYARMKTELDRLKSGGMIWSFPSRSGSSQSTVSVVSEELDPKSGKPTQFTVTERFVDRSELKAADGTVTVADGSQRGIQVTIDNITDSSGIVYKIRELKKLEM